MRRFGCIALVLALGTPALVTVAPFAVSAQQATPSGTNRIGGMMESESAAGAAAACNNSAASKLGGGAISRYKITMIYNQAEYNPETCKEIDEGKWTLNSQEKCEKNNCGTVSYGTVTGHLANGDCPQTKFSFAAICYTWNQHIDWKINDEIKATWKSTDFTLPESLPITVPIVYPTSETTAFGKWDPNGYGDWAQTLHSSSDSKLDWSLNQVQETNPGPNNPANDTCWCSGSKYPQWYKITGGKWETEESGLWEYDEIGWGSTEIQYYRQKQRAPCGTSFPQQMQFKATNVAGPWKNYGPVNTLGSSFTDTNLTSERAGKSKTESYMPVATKPRLTCSQIKWPTPPAAFASSAEVNDPRPVAAALDEIEKLSGRPVTYEDAPIVNKYYMTPMVQDTTGNPTLLVPRGSKLRFTLPADASAEHVIASVEGVVKTYNASHGAATFSVTQDGLLHVVPLQIVDPQDRLQPVTPVLNTKITLAAKRRSAMALLEEISEAVSRASGQPVGIGIIPINAFRQQQTEIGANNEPAREVLEKLLATLGMPLSWRLFYDPGTQDYALNIAVVEQPTTKP